MDDLMGTPADSLNREALEARWMDLTRAVLPAMAAARGWPIHADHCFQRVFLDHAFGGEWSRVHHARPAYRTVPAERLAAALALAEAVAAGDADLPALNRQSLAWRGKLPIHAPSPRT